jgi:hypothetical protein
MKEMLIVKLNGKTEVSADVLISVVEYMDDVVMRMNKRNSQLEGLGEPKDPMAVLRISDMEAVFGTLLITLDAN